MRLVVSFCILFLGSGIVAAESASPVPPQYSWMSERIGLPLRSLDYGPVRQSGVSEWVALSRDRIVLYTQNDTHMRQVDDYRVPEKADELLRAYLYDVDGDGRSEILVTAFRHGKVHSFILKWQGQGQWLRLVDKIRYLMAVRYYAGEATIIGQKAHYKDPFQGPLYRLSYDNGRLRAEKLAEKPNDLPDPLDVFGTQWVGLNKDHPTVLAVLAMKPSGQLMLYERENGKWVRRWTSGEHYGGATEYAHTPKLSVFNEVVQDRWFIQPDMHLFKASPAQVVVVKNADYLKGMVGKTPSVKWSELYRLEWTGMGFREAWQSERLDGTVTDFKLVDVDRDGDEEIIAALQLRDRGYMSGLDADRDSVIIMYELEGHTDGRPLSQAAH